MVRSSMLSKDEGEHLVNPTEYLSLAGALQYIVLTHQILRMQLSLFGYDDANWGLDFDDSRSMIGFCMYFSDTPISWCSKKQQVVSRSTAKAEYQNLATSTSDATWSFLLRSWVNVKV
ncbi:hypothetical protein J1N35_007801 [Gossypium stocksii]|uniref:Mitochondrial protein n=1 Tax=Gossypium stocksii TaxID=47602 RepID=A0A9D3W974_9ROSI|nr:hypothetical protein J1N35_007801 [Gossypium stocksii]